MLTKGQLEMLDEHFKVVLRDADAVRGSGAYILDRVFPGASKYAKRMALAVYADLSRDWAHVEKNRNSFSYYFTKGDPARNDPPEYVAASDLPLLEIVIKGWAARRRPFHLDSIAFEDARLPLRTAKKHQWLLAWLYLSLHPEYEIVAKYFQKIPEQKHGKAVMTYLVACPEWLDTPGFYEGQQCAFAYTNHLHKCVGGACRGCQYYERRRVWDVHSYKRFVPWRA